MAEMGEIAIYVANAAFFIIGLSLLFHYLGRR